MGANLDIYEAQHRLKNSQESSGSFKKKVAKLKKKIEASFVPEKPGEIEESKKEAEQQPKFYGQIFQDLESREEMTNPQDFV